MSDIAKHLARVVPWPSATMPGFVNVHWPTGRKTPAGDPLWTGRAYTDQQTAVGFVNGMTNRAVDLYLCMSLQATSHPEETNRKGRRQRRAIKGRITAVALRAFWLDIDIKDGKFADTTDALTKFGEWRRKVGLPEPSMVVMTGSGGFHVYWVLEEAITPDRWIPIAEALKNACQQQGFNADHSITADCARVLRIPGTYNQKHNPPRLAHIVHEGPNYPLAAIETPLAPYKTAYARGVTPAAPRQISSNLGRPSAVFAGVTLPGRLDAGLDTGYVPTIEDVADVCPFIKDTMADEGKLNWEPLWRESLRVAAFVQEGEEVAHELSRGHVSYSEVETDRKFAEVEAHKTQIGWPQCQSIYDAGSTQCKTCEHFGKHKSPLNFALPKVVASVAAAAAIAVAPGTTVRFAPQAAAQTQQVQQGLPAGYGQTKDLRIYKLVKDPDDPNGVAVPKIIVDLPIYNLQAIEKVDDIGDFGVAFDCEVMPGKVRQIKLTYEDFNGEVNILRKRMSAQGLSTEPEQGKMMGAFLVSFTQQLLAAKGRVIDCKPNGWSQDASGNWNGWCYAKKMFNGKAPVNIQPLDREIDTLYTPHGDRQICIDAMKLVTDQKRPELNAVIGASYGAPLMLWTGFNGSVFHIWSPDSGTGKSTALHCAQAVWGTTAKMSKLGDTPNAINNKLGQLRNIPLIQDELKKTRDRKLVDLIMQVQAGATKERLNRSSHAMPVYTWQTMYIGGSNSPLQGYLAEFDSNTVASMNRVIDARSWGNPKGIGMVEHTKAQRLIGELQNNHGHFGLEYSQFLGGNIDLVRESVARTQDAVNNALKGTTDDRFWIAMVAVILCGARFSNHLKHTEIDLDQLAGYLTELLQEQRGGRQMSTNNLTNQSGVERVLADFISAHRDRMLVTDRIWRPARGGHPPVGWNVGMNNALDLRNKTVVIRASKDGWVRIAVSALTAWARKERDLGRSELLTAIKEHVPGARMDKMPIADHTDIKVSRSELLELDLSQMPDFFVF